MRIQKLTALMQSFTKDQRGATAVTFALMAVPMVAIVGLGVDFSRANTEHQQMQDAIDSAVLAAVKMPDNQKIATAQAFFQTNMAGAVAPATATFHVDTAGNISGTATATVRMPFASLAQLSSTNVQLQTSATPPVAGSSPNIEVSMMIDLTGSMGQSVNGTTKIAGLKTAASSILNILFPNGATTSDKVKVAVAPFADYVNAGPYAAAATGLATTGAYANISNLASTKQGAFSGSYTGSVVGGATGSQAGAVASTTGTGSTFSNAYCATPTTTTASTHTESICNGNGKNCTSYTWPVATTYNSRSYTGASSGYFWIFNANSDNCRNAWCYGNAYYTPTTVTTTVAGCENSAASAGQLISCVTERTTTGHQFDDSSPSTGGYVGTYNKSTTGVTNKVNYSSDGKCYVAGRELPAVIPLTNSKQTVSDFFTNATVGGGTPGHLGTAWAYYLLSPNWSSIWPSSSQPAAYTSSTKKYAILMTDGEYNEQYSSITSKAQAVSLCTAMKNQGITVYTVGFGFSKTAKPNDGTTDGAALGTLQSCATGNNTFFYPFDAAALQTAFQNIGTSIMGNGPTTAATPGSLTN